ncbi:MAG: extracellular solute-binding protein [Acetatifactor sp.]|nr:extracellular solute-binding protein [Acetatifactor sp.]MDE7045096.1 extracellular solute-binding protein [Acetatifactor sp.]
MKKKLLSLLMASAMVFSMAACGNSDAGSGSSAEGQAGDQTSGAPEGSAAASDANAGREETTVSAFVMQAVTGESGIWQGWGAKKLYDDLMMKIDFEPTGNEVETKLQQYLVAGQLPDLVGLKGLDQAQLTMDADMLLPLDEYKDQLPNIFENEIYANAVRYSQDFTSNDTGHLYLMPVAIGPTAYNSLNWVPQLQWDAYKQVGMPEVTTLEDYLDVVEKMVEYKPTTEAGEKVYGFSLFSDWDNVSALEISTLSFMYGIDTEYVSPLMETNILTRETKSLLSDDSFYKRALKFYFDANQRGLLDPDSMSQTYSDVEAKFSAGRVMFSWFSWLSGSYTTDNQNNEEKVDGMASVVANDMKLYNAPEQTIGRNWYFAIAKESKNLDAALELLNWLYDPEVCFYLTNGPQGVIWDYDANGEPYVIEEDIVSKNTELLVPEDIGGGAFRDGVYSFNSLGPQAATIMDNGYTMSYRYWPSWLRRNPTLLKQEVNEMLGGVSVLSEYLEPRDMIADSTQAVNMITPASDDMEIVITQIGEIVKKYSWQMVYASDEAEFEALWNTMTEQAKQLGLDQVTEYYTQEWKKALEIVKDYE